MKAEELRAQLLAAACHQGAVQATNALVDVLLDAFNEIRMNKATSILSRALMARAIIGTAAEWWSDDGGPPAPETFKAVMSLVTDLPPHLEAISYRDDQHD